MIVLELSLPTAQLKAVAMPSGTWNRLNVWPTSTSTSVGSLRGDVQICMHLSCGPREFHQTLHRLQLKVFLLHMLIDWVLLWEIYQLSGILWRTIQLKSSIYCHAFSSHWICGDCRVWRGWTKVTGTCLYSRYAYVSILRNKNVYYVHIYMGVSENSGTPKSSILMWFSIINHPFWGTSIFGNIHIYVYNCLYIYPKLCMVHKKHLRQQWHVATSGAPEWSNHPAVVETTEAWTGSKKSSRKKGTMFVCFLELSTKHVVF